MSQQESPESVKPLIESVVCGMVDLTNEVDIECHVSSTTAIVDIRVADSDVGKVLGKKGVYAEALRMVFGAIYGKQGKRLVLSVIPSRR